MKTSFLRFYLLIALALDHAAASPIPGSWGRLDAEHSNGIGWLTLNQRPQGLTPSEMTELRQARQERQTEDIVGQIRKQTTYAPGPRYVERRQQSQSDSVSAQFSTRKTDLAGVVTHSAPSVAPTGVPNQNRDRTPYAPHQAEALQQHQPELTRVRLSNMPTQLFEHKQQSIHAGTPTRSSPNVVSADFMENFSGVNLEVDGCRVSADQKGKWLFKTFCANNPKLASIIDQNMAKGEKYWREKVGY